MSTRWELAATLGVMVTAGCGPVEKPRPRVVTVVDTADASSAEPPPVPAPEARGLTKATIPLDPVNIRRADCAMEGAVEGLRCGFVDPTDVTGISAKKNPTILQPVVTGDGRRVLVAGVWHGEAVSQHLALSDRRFLATCTLDDVGRAIDVKVRPGFRRPWVEAGDLPVFRARDCSMEMAPPAARIHIPLEPHSPRLGPEHAKVTIVMFGDLQCRHCARVAPVLQRVAEANPKNVAVHFRHFPLKFHQRALPAAVAAQAAERQGKGWPLLELMFQNRMALSDQDILGYAKILGLDLSKLKAAIASSDVRAEVKTDEMVARSKKVRGTPTLFVNGEKYISKRTKAAFQYLIDAEVERADALLAKGTAIETLYEELCE